MPATEMRAADGAKARLMEVFARVSAVEPAGPALYHGDKIFTRGELREAAREVGRLLDAAGVPAGAPVAWVARNQPGMIAAALGLLLVGRCISLINPHEPENKVADAVRRLRACAVIAGPDDWTGAMAAAVGETGAAGLEIALDATPAVRLREGLDRVRGDGHHQAADDTVVELLTSGTTGDPKRLPLGADRLLTGLALGIRKDRSAPGASDQEDLTVKRSPSLLSGPMSHVGGLFRVLLSVKELRPIVVRERFRVADFVEDMRRYRPKSVSLVPAAAAMVLEADVPAEVFADVVLVRSGTAPLPPPIKRAFEMKYGIPILSEYGASEFFGGITNWTLSDYEKYGAEKYASVGRPKRDVEVRILDPETRFDLGVEQIGILTLKSPRFGPEWIPTTDLASRDADGFIYIHGRSDQAIIRGGFKILPEKVADVFRQRDDVAEACVIGVKDPVLGHTPIVIVQPEQGRPWPTPAELEAYARANLAGYQVPVAYELMDQLPRTATLKVALGAVRELLRDRYDF